MLSACNGVNVHIYISGDRDKVDEGCVLNLKHFFQSSDPAICALRMEIVNCLDVRKAGSFLYGIF